MSQHRPEAVFRRAQRVAGLMLGAFLVVHLWNQSRVLGGSLAYERWLASQRHPLESVATAALFVLPALFYVGYGGWSWWQTRRAPVAAAVRWQRWSAVVAVPFIGWHIYLHAWPEVSGARTWADRYQLAVEIYSSTSWGLPIVAAATLLGLAVVLFHGVSGLLLPQLHEGEPAVSPMLRATARPYAITVAVLLFLLGAAIVLHCATGLGGADDPWRWEPSGGAAWGG